jgi:hypothetical protein
MPAQVNFRDTNPHARCPRKSFFKTPALPCKFQRFCTSPALAIYARRPSRCTSQQIFFNKLLTKQKQQNSRTTDLCNWHPKKFEHNYSQTDKTTGSATRKCFQDSVIFLFSSMPFAIKLGDCAKIWNFSHSPNAPAAMAW